MCDPTISQCLTVSVIDRAPLRFHAAALVAALERTFLYMFCDENILNHALYNHPGIHPVHNCLSLLSIRALKFASPTSNDLALHVFLTVEPTCARPAYRFSNVHNRLTQTF